MTHICDLSALPWSALVFVDQDELDMVQQVANSSGDYLSRVLRELLATLVELPYQRLHTDDRAVIPLALLVALALL